MIKNSSQYAIVIRFNKKVPLHRKNGWLDSFTSLIQQRISCFDDIIEVFVDDKYDDEK